MSDFEKLKRKLKFDFARAAVTTAALGIATVFAVSAGAALPAAALSAATAVGAGLTVWRFLAWQTTC